MTAQPDPHTDPETGLKKRPLILAALPAELKALRARVQREAESFSGDAAVITGRLGTRPVRLAWSGIGVERAAQAAAWIARTFPTSYVVLTGYAGGTRPGQRPGLLIAATEVRRQGSKALRPDERLLDKVLETVDATPGAIHTVEEIAGGAEAKAAHGAKGAHAVEMETHAAADALQEAGVPWVALRAVLDPLTQSVAGVEKFSTAHGGVRPLALAGALARDPALTVRLVQLASHQKKAAAALTEALVRILETF